MTSRKHIVDILIPITISHNCNIDIWNYNCDYPKLYLWIVKKKVVNVERACHSRHARSPFKTNSSQRNAGLLCKSAT